ncbi:MAG: hypothetical protein P4L03_01060 [Terracidiphilus sp.]|nr:hypothetical protein [Terracidiphilus sp.]
MEPPEEKCKAAAVLPRLDFERRVYRDSGMCGKQGGDRMHTKFPGRKMNINFVPDECTEKKKRSGKGEHSSGVKALFILLGSYVTAEAVT